jgi:hypothetical protein
MTDSITATLDSAEIGEIIRGAVDTYVHPGPELLPRVIDVVSLARQMKEDGFGGAMLWNQFSHTGEIAEIVTGVTGFQLYGSVILNGTVGGVNPHVAEHAIRMGARYVSMPSLSGSAAYLADAAAGNGYANEAMRIAGPVRVTDEAGALLPHVHEVLEVVRTYDVALGLGYLDEAEAIAVLDGARDHGVSRIGILRPLSGLGFTAEQLEVAMGYPGTIVQIPASALRSIEAANGGLPNYAEVASGVNPQAEAFARLVGRYGAERCVLSSDTGWNDVTALQWIQLGAEALAQFGVTARELDTLVHASPKRLLGLA